MTATAAAATPAFANDRVLRLYSDGATALTGFGQGQTGQTEASSANLTAITDAAGPAAGVSTGADTATTAAAQNWEADTVALEPQQGASSINVPRPLTNATGNDFLLVAVTAKALGGGSICAPTSSPGGPWSEVQEESVTNITQETFYYFPGTATADPGPYPFTFTTGPNCTGSAATETASAVAVRYTGVNPLDSIDASDEHRQNTNPTAPSVGTAVNGDAIVRLYGTLGASISCGRSTGTICGDTVTATGSATSTGITDAIQTASGNTGTANVTTANAAWAADTIAIGPTQAGCAHTASTGSRITAVSEPTTRT